MDGADSQDDKRSSVVIVALPSEADRRVHEVSSEKKAHLTLLFLGETDFGGESEAVVQFVEHAAKTSLRRFGLSVDRRGTLGDDDADVLFFSKGMNMREISDFRAALLQNPHISKAYNSVEQYPEWTPHLTLGYPDAPAREDDRDYDISWVNFDRIAIWFDDSDGPEFQLKDYDMTEVAMSSNSGADAAEAVLAHYGVKGMKWGVRRTAAQLARAAQATGAGAKKTAAATVSGAKKTKAGAAAARDIIDTRSEDAKKAEAIASKINRGGDLRKLSNTEIQTLVTRIQLEQNYARLNQTPKKQTLIQRGASFTAKLATDIAAQQSRKVASAYANKYSDDFLRKNNVVVPKSGKKKSKKADSPAPPGPGPSNPVTARSSSGTFRVNPSKVTVRPG